MHSPLSGLFAAITVGFLIVGFLSGLKHWEYGMGAVMCIGVVLWVFSRANETPSADKAKHRKNRNKGGRRCC